MFRNRTIGLTDEDDSVVGWNMPPDTGAPPPYSPKNQLQRGANKSLKFSQVEVLKREMSHSGGIRVMLRRSDCHHSLALVDVNSKVCIECVQSGTVSIILTVFCNSVSKS